ENAVGATETGEGTDGASDVAATGLGTAPAAPVGVAPMPPRDGPATVGASGEGNDGRGSPGIAAKYALAMRVRRSGSGSPGGGRPPPLWLPAAAARASRSVGP